MRRNDIQYLIVRWPEDNKRQIRILLRRTKKLIQITGWPTRIKTTRSITDARDVEYYQRK